MPDRKKPTSIFDALKSDLERAGVGIVNAASSIPRFVQSHMQEYKPGMSVADMPQTMEVLPEAASTATMLPATTGVASVPGISLASGLRRPPPVVGTYHGTPSPDEFTKFKLPPPEHDLGIHTTVNPNIGATYAFKEGLDEGVVDFMSGKVFGAPGTADPRIKPVLTDARSALEFPGDAVKWNEPEGVINTLRDAMKEGFIAPKGLLSDFHNISSSNKMWQDQFTPMLKDKGYDSLWYPHMDSATGRETFNTFMAFDPKQVVHRYSPEGRELIKKRGVIDPITKGLKDFDPDEGKFFGVPSWDLPRGILKPTPEIESLVKSPSRNTRQWWEDPNSPLSKTEAKIEAETLRKHEEANKAFEKYLPKPEPYKLPSASVLDTEIKRKNLADLEYKQTRLDLQLQSNLITKKERDLKWNALEDEIARIYGEAMNKSILAKENLVKKKISPFGNPPPQKGDYVYIPGKGMVAIE